MSQLPEDAAGRIIDGMGEQLAVHVPADTARQIDMLRVLIRTDTPDWAPAVRNGALIALDRIQAAVDGKVYRPRLERDAAPIPMREGPALDPRAAWPFPGQENRAPAMKITARGPDGVELASWQRDAGGRLVEPDDGKPT